MQAQDLSLFQAALGLSEPWRVTSVEFDVETKRLDLRVDFPRGATFCCPECDRSGLKAHDTEEKRWRHLDFFQHQAFLSARVPRVRCPEHKVRLVAVPWARERSGFTLLFEALVMAMVREMPVAPVAALIGEDDMRVWRIVHHYVDEAVDAQDLSGTERVGVDDTSFRRGQSYVSVFADLDERRSVFVTDGRDQATVEQFAGFLESHGGEAKQITEVCQDMSEAYVSGVRKHLPSAEITFDRYHIRQQLGKALDEVRRGEAKQHKQLLRNTRYLWLKRPENLSVKQLDWLDELLQQPLDTVRAYDQALRFEDFYDLDADAAEEYLRRWVTDARDTELQPLIKFAQMIEEHWPGIIRWHHSQVSNGLLEGLNSLIQAAKRRARGYRSTRNYKAMIYLVAGKLRGCPGRCRSSTAVRVCVRRREP
ncbi:MAG: ISL3 family transposase [Actinomycetota bacterium]|nr:ISL3 family transposase [Actinomycetota bacterium]